MTTLTLELPEHLARKLADADQQTVLRALEIGLEQLAYRQDEQATEHPHIIRKAGFLGGSPIIRGSRTPIWHVANAIVRLGDSVEYFLDTHRSRTLAEVHDALSYYFDHRETIDKEIEDNLAQIAMKVASLAEDAAKFRELCPSESPAGEAQPTEHPHIYRKLGTLGGSPVIRDHRIAVQHVAKAIIHMGETVQDYLASYPQLTPAQVYDALSYYFDHREEIEQEIEDSRTENVMKKFGFTIDERGVVQFNKDEPSRRE